MDATASCQPRIIAKCQQDAKGRVLTAAEITAHDTFQQPKNVKPVEFKDFRLTDDVLHVTLPAKSVVVLEIE